MTELLQTRMVFTDHVARLLQRAPMLGFRVTLGECMRSDEQAEINAIGREGRERLARIVRAAFPTLADRLLNNGRASGIRASLHTLGLAVDLNLYTPDGTYLDKSDDHRELGEWWEAQHPLARWGGRFGDGNHYSFTYGGRR